MSTLFSRIVGHHLNCWNKINCNKTRDSAMPGAELRGDSTNPFPKLSSLHCSFATFETISCCLYAIFWVNLNLINNFSIIACGARVHAQQHVNRHTTYLTRWDRSRWSRMISSDYIYSGLKCLQKMLLNFSRRIPTITNYYKVFGWIWN